MTTGFQAAALPLACLLASAATTALAQTQATPPTGAAASGRVISYPLSFFAEYRATNAQDIVGRVPGFVYKAGDDVRGFSGAAGNVLIDGERPSSKAVTLDDALRRVPVDQIERVDLIRGGAPGIDMQGQPVLVNIVRRKGAGSSLAVELMSKVYDDHDPGVQPRIEGATQIGRLKLEGAVNARFEKQQGDSGSGPFTRRDGAGAVLARGPFQASVEQRSYVASGSAALDDLRLNIGLLRDEFPRNEYVDLVSSLGVSNREQTVNDLVTNKAEIGGDYQHALGHGLTLGLIGLYTHKDSDLASVSTGRGPVSTSTKTSTGSESIARGTLSGRFGGVSIETGGEAAFNVLDLSSGLQTGGVSIALPSANVRVEERRAEAFVNGSGKLAPGLAFDGGLRFETSTITQSGDVSQRRSLRFAKPRLTLSYDLTPSSQVRLRLERTVGQLNFEDFAASGDLSAGVLTAGNSNLEPERAWVSEMAVEKRFWTKGAIVLTASHSAVQQVSDVVPIVTPTAVYDAPGNLGDGTKDELTLNLALPFDRLKLQGLSLRLNSTWRRTRVADPTTGEERPFSTLNPWEAQFFITQDMPRLKSILTINSMPMGTMTRQYRSTETRFDSTSPYVNISWQYRPRPDTQLTVQAENIFGRERRRQRVIYAGARSAAPVARQEGRVAELSPFLVLKVRRVF